MDEDLNDHIGKYTGIYTIATMEEKCENCSQESIDRRFIQENYNDMRNCHFE